MADVLCLVHLRYVDWSSRYLSLPTVPGLTIVATFLPLVASLNTLYLSSRKRSSQNYWICYLLQGLQAIVSTVLATIFALGTIPSALRGCSLQTAWRRFWTSHDGESIQRIQNAFQCCGYLSIKDMAWPFPHGDPKDPQATCAMQFARTLACHVPWDQALRRNSAIGLGLVLAVCLLQVVSVWWENDRQTNYASPTQTRGNNIRFNMGAAPVPQRRTIGGPYGIYGSMGSSPRTEPSVIPSHNEAREQQFSEQWL
ncbi:hypothetical protein GQ53DRAFT_740796 [Thozetella sp. PMI_491]|nr:hypothetical protein GQ53DRAFT_740796 [Thozetella sp. PMI_491]